MKVKVLKRFKDKYTKALHETNTTVEMTKERVDEINSTSLGIFVEAILGDFIGLTKKELLDVAKRRSIEINTRMTKDEIIKHLREV